MMTNDRIPTIIGAATVNVDVLDDPTDYWGLGQEVAARAIEDAGVDIKDIDGVVFITSVWPPERVLTSAAYLAQTLRITPAWTKMIPYGGTPISEHLMWASIALKEGFAKTVLCVASENLNSRLTRTGVVKVFAETANNAEWEGPFGPLLPSNFGMIAQRHMHEYGTTPEQLAAVAVGARKWAAMNPEAAMQKPLSIEDVVSSRMISSPMHMLDLSLVSDGAAAFVVTTKDRATDTPKKPVHVLGYGSCTDSQNLMFNKYLTRMPALTKATAQALESSGLSRDELDIVYPYDPATISPIMELESMGFCEPGEGGAFVSDGKIEPGGSFPINTHGGLLSCAHPGPSASLIQMVEAVRQLRGECGDRQVEGARTALTLGEGGFYSWQVNVLGTEV
jgi:acetyl-CoA acetyltransferase